MSKHTPGPWIADTEDNSVLYERENKTLMLVAQARSKDVSIEVRDANTRLIAAAPDLLEALKKAKWMLERDYIDDQKMAIIEKCDDAISNALGDEE